MKYMLDINKSMIQLQGCGFQGKTENQLVILAPSICLHMMNIPFNVFSMDTHSMFVKQINEWWMDDKWVDMNG